MLEFKSSVSDTDKGWDKLAKTLKDMSTKTVKVGIQASEDSELLTIANVQEFGADINVTSKMRGFFRAVLGVNLKKTTTTIKIPSRPFIRQTFDKRLDELTKIGFDLGGLVIDDKLMLEQSLEIWGEKLVAFIRNEIAEGNNFEPNAPLTIERKGAGKHPLQDSGRLQQALKAVVFGRRGLKI